MKKNLMKAYRDHFDIPSLSNKINVNAISILKIWTANRYCLYSVVNYLEGASASRSFSKIDLFFFPVQAVVLNGYLLYH